MKLKLDRFRAEYKARLSCTGAGSTGASASRGEEPPIGIIFCTGKILAASKTKADSVAEAERRAA